MPAWAFAAKLRPRGIAETIVVASRRRMEVSVVCNIIGGPLVAAEHSNSCAGCLQGLWVKKVTPARHYLRGTRREAGGATVNFHAVRTVRPTLSSLRTRAAVAGVLASIGLAACGSSRPAGRPRSYEAAPAGWQTGHEYVVRPPIVARSSEWPQRGQAPSRPRAGMNSPV